MIIGISGKIGSGKDTVAKIIQMIADGQLDDVPEYRLELAVKNLPVFEAPTWEIEKFAGKLKDIVCLLIGCTRAQLEDQIFKNTPLPPEWDKFEVNDFMKPTKKVFAVEDEATKWCYEHNNSQHAYTVKRIQITPRWLLQVMGTEVGRQIIHPNLWILSTFTQYRSEDRWIITDVRFPNEAEAIKQRGGTVVRIERPCPECGVVQGHKMIPHVNPPSEHESETALDDYEFEHTIINDGTIAELVDKVDDFFTNFK